ncbi:hypothetical protein ACQKNX_02680 [Lysinibacillus sp. NPDC093712]|uniref:hypothetical protein n=1 Tax=Lysinibacillus sp. NPDC093712 TaxID=3390579 RepID=UPI003D034DC2
MIIHIVSDQMLINYWLLIFTAVIDLTIILQFGNILSEIEQQYNKRGTISKFMQKYKWIVVSVIVSWTFLMHLIYMEQIILLFFGAALLCFVNIGLLMHVRKLKQHIKSTMQMVTYAKK